jgi:phosphatidylserine/phosphatidylglycerophosphate/cardiolipin synthase-like enzyme
MRSHASATGLTALAVAGNHVVLLGWDMSAADILGQSVMGFALCRTRHRDGERSWLKGFKTFEAVEPFPPPGEPVSSFTHPFQTFQWADYSVVPDEAYTYEIVAMTGAATALLPGPKVILPVKTERVDLGKHAVFFNRGAVASQEYARRFQNRPPAEVGPSAYDWLSRGLVEGLEAFIAQAGAGDELLGAFFEFKNQRIHAAIKRAAERGALVSVLYDADSQKAGNEAALVGSGIEHLVKPRNRSGGYAHNKFLVLRQAGASSQVWTGSTNLSENGLYGHSNNAHQVRDPVLAEQYFQYWRVLDEDLTRKPTALRAEPLSPLPPAGDTTDTVALFSPRTSMQVLDWYAQQASQTQRGLFATFAFGMNDRFVPAYDRADGVLRFALMEKKGNGAQFKAQAAEIDRIRRHPNVTIAVGHRVELNNFDRWLAEIDRVVGEAHVLYVHTKYMLIDPLGAEPTVIVGSANFSEASTDTNDENMLLIRGNTTVADIYLGEFMRLFSHYAFRESLSFKDASTPANALRRKYLIPSPRWIEGERRGSGYFDEGSDRTLRRRYFSGRPA